MTRQQWIDRELRRQLAIPGARLTEREKLQRLADKPLAPTRPQQTASGLFDAEARNQIDLIDLLGGDGRAEDAPSQQQKQNE